ncbi:MAG: PIN domain-containing protein [Opitutus sp.]|nr:PIN domain-containing protein [Opitutus sp.]
MPVYPDTNLLVRLYTEMPESPLTLQRFENLRRNRGARLPITWLHQMELTNAFQQLVFLARQGGGIRMSPERAMLCLADFDEDLVTGHGLYPAAVAATVLVREARQLSLRHTAGHGFRAYDVAHVACALLLDCDVFWSFDTKANELAKLEGLKTL